MLPTAQVQQVSNFLICYAVYLIVLAGPPYGTSKIRSTLLGELNQVQPNETTPVSTINQYANAATYVRATIVGSQAQQQRLEQSKRHAHDNVAANALKRPNVTVVKAIGTISAAIDLLARNVDANLEALSAAPVGHLPNDHQHRLLATSLEATSLNIHCKCATSRVPFEIFSFKFAYSTVRSHRCRTFIRCRHSSSLVID